MSTTAVTREAVARAIHEGLGDSWAYANYSGNEWVSCRDMLDRAADSVLALPQIAADSPDVTTRLAEAEDRAAKAEARAEKMEATPREWKRFSEIAFEYKAQIAELTTRAEKAEATVTTMKGALYASRIEVDRAEEKVDELTRKLDEAKSVLREVEWVLDNAGNSICWICCNDEKDGHKPGCRLAAVLAPETGKGDAP